MNDRAVTVYSWVAAAAVDGDGVSLTALCQAAVDRLGMQSASVSALAGPDVLEPVAVAGPQAAEMEDLQFTVGEGPCLAAVAFASPMLVPDLAEMTARWPGYAAVALERGVVAVFAFPLHAGAIRLGTLEFYRHTPGPLSPDVLADALVFADLALWLLLDRSSGLAEDGDHQPTDGTGAGREVVHQATGMISVQLGVDMVEALARLRAYTFAGSTTLGEVATDVVQRRLRLHPDVDPETDDLP